jgi:hypothetical protein
VGDGGEGAEGAEEQVGGVGHDGGAAGSDFVTGLELRDVDMSGR